MALKKVIDARGLYCPGPLQVLKGVIKQLKPGSVLELLADDPDSQDEIRNWCEETGNSLNSVDVKNGEITFNIKVKS